MHFRRSAAVLMTAAAVLSTGCQTKIDDRGVAQSASFAAFDPTKSQIPLPNDLALASIPAAAVAAGCGAALPDAKTQFLCALKASGGFPNDQEVALTFAFQRQVVDASGNLAADPVVLDTTTIRVLGAVASGATVAVFDVTGAPTVVPVVVEASFDAAAGTLKLRKPAAADGSRRWTAGHRYAAFVRGGASGVKTLDGAEVQPMPTMFVLREAIVTNRDLTDPNNQTLLPGTPEQKAAAGAQLEQIRRGYAPLAPLFAGAFSTTFEEMVNLLTFTVAPSAGAVVEVDSSKGSAPLPIDMLRAPDALGGRILANPAFGAAGAGLVQLDGFSTTGPITAPITGGPGAIDAGTVNGANVFLFEVGNATTQLRELKAEIGALRAGAGGNPAAAAYVAQPDGSFVPSTAASCPDSTGGCATSIVLQPAVPAVAAGVYLPPLKGGTKYAVVVTKRVKDVLGNPLGRSTAAKIILELAAPVDASIGVDAGTAALLQQMRTDLAPVWSALPAGTTKADVAMAYVFKTQKVVDASVQLSAVPHLIEAKAGAVFLPALATSVTSSYPDVTNVAGIYSVLIPSLDATSKVTGALDPTVLDPAASVTTIAAHLRPLKAIVAFPAGFTGARPLVVFGHGLNGSKEMMLAAAPVPGAQPAVNALLAKGFVVAAIDFPHHGDRAWCFANAQCDDNGAAGTCTPFAEGVGPAYQGDTASCGGAPIPPGTCTVGRPIAGISGQTFIGANFFRTRDAFRQNLIDQSALALALARPSRAPAPPATFAAGPYAAALAADGITVSADPTAIYWEGISLGGIAGTEVLATNPRFTRGVTSVAGGSLVDVFTKSPSFQEKVGKLFACLLKPQLDAVGAGGFDAAYVDPSNASSFAPAVAAAYGKTVLTAKWILDPGDALNFARHLKAAPLPNLLADATGATPQDPKSVLGQVAVGDVVIPNPFNLELYRNGGVDTMTYRSGGLYLDLGGVNAMHSILAFDPAVQGHAADYLDSPAATLPASPFDLP